MQSFVEPWMKQFAYATILLRKDGYPCVFYGDLFGIPHSNVQPVAMIKTLMALRKLKAYGRQHDYFDHKNVIGWTREGDNRHLDSGLAVIGQIPLMLKKECMLEQVLQGRNLLIVWIIVLMLLLLIVMDVEYLKLKEKVALFG